MAVDSDQVIDHPYRQYSMKFPVPNFDYGGAVDSTIAENELLRRELTDSDAEYPAEWAPLALAHRHQKLVDNNRLEVSELHLKDVDDPQGLLGLVLKLVPPTAGADRSVILKYLAQSKPMKRPSKGGLWIQARKWLDEAAKQGAQGGWRDDNAIRMGPVPPEITMRDKLPSTGFYWIAAPPSQRNIPKCWEAWAKAHGIDYRAVISITKYTTGDAVKNRGDAASPGLDGASAHDMTDAEDDRFLSPETTYQQANTDYQKRKARASDALNAMRTNPQPRTEARGSRPEVLILKSPEGAGTQVFVAVTLENAVVEGPVEGLVRETVENAVINLSGEIRQQEMRVRQLEVQVDELAEQAEEQAQLGARLGAFKAELENDLCGIRRGQFPWTVEDDTSIEDGADIQPKRSRTTPTDHHVEIKSFVPIKWT
ncbi:hypothetical protein GGS21DRAFT_489060 [Xylaria nigripes]|nr:hypothetical protein GGS21DRAFT_489060 [Xylaria nigripes]